MPRELVHTALFAVDDADRRAAGEPRLAQGLDGRKSRAAGGDDVLDEANALSRLERALQAICGSVVLCVLAHDEERQSRLERCGGGECDGAELRTGDPHGLGIVLADLRSKPLAKRAKKVGPRLEAVLVEVIARAAAAAQDEVPLEVRVLLERAPQLVVVHGAHDTASVEAQETRTVREV